MKSRAVIFGVLLAVAGVVLQYLYMLRFEEEASGGSKIELLVATQPIQRGQPITAEALGTRAVPQAYVDERAIRASDRDKVLNLRAAATVPVLQTLAWTDLIATADDQRDLSALVQPGNRALPIRLEATESLQLIRPGDFVDILGIFGQSRSATVLLQRVLVLAVGTHTTIEQAADNQQTPRRAGSLLTVSVSLRESQLLALAEDVGELAAVVRNPDDQKIVESPPDVGGTELFDTQARESVKSSRRQQKRPVELKAEFPQ